MRLRTFSWIRTYHCPIDLPRRTGSDPGTRRLVPDGGIELTREELVDHAFFDLQMINEGAVERFRLPGISLELPGPGNAPLRVDATLHYLFHVSGFLVLRLTGDAASFSPQPATGRPDSELELARQLFDVFWEPGEVVGWSLGKVRLPPLSVRGILTSFFLYANDNDGGSRQSTAAAEPEGADRERELERFAMRASDEFGELSRLANDKTEAFSFVYPVSGVTHFEFEATEPSGHIADAEELLFHGLAIGRKESAPARAGEWWGLNDNLSVSLSRGHRPTQADLGTISSIRPTRTQLVEILALRLGVLWSIQRDTQRFLITGRRLPGQTLSQWQKALLTANDDWTLDGRVGGRLATLERLLDLTAGARSIRRLRDQVSLSISTFQRRFDVAGQRAPAILGVVFSIVATTSLASIFWLALAGSAEPEGGGNPSLDRWVLDNWKLVVGVEVGLILVAAASIWVWFRRASSGISFGRK